MTLISNISLISNIFHTALDFQHNEQRILTTTTMRISYRDIIISELDGKK